MSTSSISNAGTVAQFGPQLDALKIVTLTDGEVWSARELMKFAGYIDWRNWSKAIDRARASVNASGQDPSDHFVESNNMIATGKGARREVEDFNLTRYACYILFQNADGSKPEIAAMQQYFAVQTRKQEVASPQLPGTYLEALKALVSAEELKAQLAEQIALDAPKAAAFDRFIDSDGNYPLEAAAKMLGTGRSRLTSFLRRSGLMLQGNTTPVQRFVDRGYFRVITRTYDRRFDNEVRPVQYEVTVVTPKGLEFVRGRMVSAGEIEEAS